jgi:hypothetical protein
MLSATDLADARALEPTLPETDEMLPLTTIPEVIGFVATAARADGGNEVDAVELTVRLADLSPDAVRDIECTLRRLGYRDVCARLRQIAGRRKHDLAPL